MSSAPSSGRSLERTFAVSTALLVLILMGSTMLAVRGRVASSLRAGLEARGESVARSIASITTPSLLAYNYPALQMAAEGASANPGVLYVAIHDKEGNLAGVAGHTPGGEPPASVGLIRGSGPTVSEVDVPRGDGAFEEALEVSAPVYVEGVSEPWGLVRVGLSVAPMAADLRATMFHMIAVGAVLVAAAVAGGRWMARRTTAPLRRLAEGTEALSRGDMSHRIPVQGAREIADLARAFNRMMDRVQEKARESAEFQAALERLNETLEQQVLDRTRALEESTDQYRILVEHSPDSILIVQDGRIRFANRSFCETFGVLEDDVLAPEFRLGKVFDPSSAALAEGRIAAWERGETPSPTEVLGRDAQGRLRHLELRGSRIEYQSRPAAECLLVDMTEAKRLRERLNETERLRALGELSGGVAHDFNNLLGAVLGRIQLLRKRDFPPDVDHDMAVIEKAAQDGRETVRRIQEFSRTRRDKRFSAIDLEAVFRDAVEITKTRWKNEAEQRNIKVQLVWETEPVPPILGSASELREVVTNLILNAVDAMPQGGTLRVGCRKENDRVAAWVADTGVGMSESVRSHVFDPFFTTKGNRGTGLGLSLVYGIVTRHEGRIDIVTALGRGTTFLLDFPAVDASLVVAGGDGTALPELVRPGRILVIDDEPEVAEVVRDVLANEGHTVEVALSGREGVELAAGAAFDLVFTDLGMPDMSGWDVAERLAETCPSLPVALVTGWGTTLDEDDARRRGVVAVVQKPFEISDLVQTTTRLLARGPRL